MVFLAAPSPPAFLCSPATVTCRPAGLQLGVGGTQAQRSRRDRCPGLGAGEGPGQRRTEAPGTRTPARGCPGPSPLAPQASRPDLAGQPLGLMLHGGGGGTPWFARTWPAGRAVGGVDGAGCRVTAALGPASPVCLPPAKSPRGSLFQQQRKGGSHSRKSKAKCVCHRLFSS